MNISIPSAFSSAVFLLVSLMVCAYADASTTVPADAGAESGFPARSTHVAKPGKSDGVTPLRFNAFDSSTATANTGELPVWPSDQDIFRLRIFSNPLVPVGKSTSESNRQFGVALRRFLSQKDLGEFVVFEEFLSRNPDSVWAASLWGNLGDSYYRNGYFSRALHAWEASWELSKTLTTNEARSVADYSFGQLMRMNARLGRMDAMGRLSEETKDRVLTGSGGSLAGYAREGLWMMKNEPGQSFRCGPLALLKILQYNDPKIVTTPVIEGALSTHQGTSLQQLHEWAKESNLNYVPARKSGEGDYLTPSIVHWSLGHFAALVKRNGDKFLVQDATSGEDLWVSRKALDEETSGYYLIPENLAASTGWSIVGSAEASNVWGKGNTGSSDTTANGLVDIRCGSDDCPKGMTAYSFHAMLASLSLQDTPIGYNPPLGPSVHFTVAYSQRETFQPSMFYYSNMGKKWTHTWFAFVQDDAVTSTANVNLYKRGGGTDEFIYNAGTGGFDLERYSRTELLRTSLSPIEYEHVYLDGSREVYSLSDGAPAGTRRIFLTRVVDRTGNAVTLHYDGDLRLVAIEDAIGQMTTICYDDTCTTTTSQQIARVTDPFGRSASFEYDLSGRLTSITDVIGIESRFTYDAGDFVTALTTPYGTTTFAKEPNGSSAQFRWVEATNTQGEKERVEYTHTSGIPATVPANEIPDSIATVNNYIQYRNTFFWDKRAMQMAPRDYSSAFIYHWLHKPASAGSKTSRLLESVKPPLESRIWFEYFGQPAVATPSIYEGTQPWPSKVARRIEESGGAVTQLYQFTWNDKGGLTKAIDPLGRETTYTYDANLVDLLTVSQKVSGGTELLMSASYNAHHQPLTVTDVAGKTWTYSYNANGQVVTSVNPLGEFGRASYDTDGYLVGLASDDFESSVTMVYDSHGRVERLTAYPDNYSLEYTYDDFDRVTSVVYPDSTYTQGVYDRLDLAMWRDREGKWTNYYYDSRRRTVAVRDAQGLLTQFDWCGCGSLSRLIDAGGKMTSWLYDLQGRPTRKIHEGNTFEDYVYESRVGRLKKVVDGKRQERNFTYYNDNMLKTISHANTAAGTTSVGTKTYNYSAYYPRVTSMVDDSGTTLFTYGAVNTGDGIPGDNQLASIDGPLAGDTISYTYDELGRVLQRSVGSDVVTVTYDNQGRVDSSGNGIGSFAYDFVTGTGRLASIVGSTGHRTNFDYDSAMNDFRLGEIENLGPSGTPLSKFNYDYNPAFLISEWTQQAGSGTPFVDAMSYDASDRLTGITRSLSSSVVKRFAFRNDAAGNLVGQQVDDISLGEVTALGGTVNRANQLLNLKDEGPVHVSGTLDEPGLVTIDDVVIATDVATDGFEAWAEVDAFGKFNIRALDYSDNETSKTVSVALESPGDNSFTYDRNGNMLSGLDGAVYTWDVNDRLRKAETGACSVSLDYNVAGLPYHLVQMNGMTEVAERWFIWDGSSLVEERYSLNGGPDKVRRIYAEGEEDDGNDLYYSYDHLGSVREITDASGIVQKRYDYTAYGSLSLLTGSAPGSGLLTTGFTGHIHFQWQGMELVIAPYRIYDPRLGRWLSRDPIAEAGGINLYQYVGGNPINAIDPLGLVIWRRVFAGGAGAVGGVALGVAGISLSATGIGAFLGIPMIGGGAAMIGLGAGEMAAGFTESECGPIPSTLGEAFAVSNPDSQVAIWGGFAFDTVTQVGIPKGLAPLKGLKSAGGAAKGGLNPNTIRFSQDSIKAGFQNTAHGTIDDLAAGLRSGAIKPSSIEPIRLVEREGHLISIDNRRLEAFRRAGVDVPTRMATPAEIQQAIQQGKFSAGELGGTTIRVRGQ